MVAWPPHEEVDKTSDIMDKVIKKWRDSCEASDLNSDVEGEKKTSHLKTGEQGPHPGQPTRVVHNKSNMRQAGTLHTQSNLPDFSIFLEIQGLANRVVSSCSMHTYQKAVLEALSEVQLQHQTAMVQTLQAGSERRLQFPPEEEDIDVQLPLQSLEESHDLLEEKLKNTSTKKNKLHQQCVARP
ncbi:uncharacterized protein LOC122983113 isoform X2 [Thunnus albacares]|uniref:uncharacterized protein LOC122983113 isoform X2 n=1 Tax=Thunnus albacares TaxID=8236 RepID=UPI001CF675CE|nr:uncharacterized protein LOC122983113 isoform X2 [Thunnus albacares]